MSLAHLVRSSLPVQETGKPRVSFEFFPPKSEAAEAELWATLDRLAPLNPRFVSVTYGALGTTRDETRGVMAKMVADPRVAPAAHLTCYGGAREEVDAIIQDYWDLGVRHMVSLRGDLPQDADRSVLDGGYQNATELTAAISRIAPFEISVAAYPEKHPESPSLQHDINVLKAKVDAGATRAITQFFFDVEAFYRYVDMARAAGITIPIVPGVMPIVSFKGLVRMAGRCDVSLPEKLHRLFDGLDEVPQSRALVSAAVAAEICAELNNQGFSELHLYTLNKPDLTYAVCRTLGLEDASISQAVA